MGKEEFSVKWIRVCRLKEYMEWGRNMLSFYMFDTPKLNFELQEAFLFERVRRDCSWIRRGFSGNRWRHAEALLFL